MADMIVVSSGASVGLVTDARARVLDADGKPIARLTGRSGAAMHMVDVG